MGAGRPAVIGLDIGTSTVKGLLIDADGVVVARGARSHVFDIGSGGRVEVEADDVARAARHVISQLADRADRAGLRVRALCAGGSGDEAVWVDRAGAPIAPVPLSLDMRDVAIGEATAEVIGSTRYREITGLPPSGAYPVVRFAALRAGRPDAAARVSRMLAWPEALALDLGIEPLGEPSLAARSGAWRVEAIDRGAAFGGDDVLRDGYEPAILEAVGAARGLFPQVVPTGAIVGVIPPRTAAAVGLPAGVRLVAGGFDQAMATLGAGITTSGVAHVGAGSWHALTLLSNERPPVDLVVDGFSIGPSIAADGLWSIMASGPGTVVLGWLGRVGEQRHHPARRIAALAARAPDEPTGLTVIPDLGGGAPPRPDPRARGVIAGLGLTDGPERLARAVMEGVAIGLGERLERAALAGLTAGEIRVSGGGARDRRSRQLIADVSGLPVRAVDPLDAGATAAAALAAATVGLAPDVRSALARTVRIGPPVLPRPGQHAAYRAMAERTSKLRSSIAAVQRGGPDT